MRHPKKRSTAGNLRDKLPRWVFLLLLSTLWSSLLVFLHLGNWWLFFPLTGVFTGVLLLAEKYCCRWFLPGDWVDFTLRAVLLLLITLSAVLFKWDPFSLAPYREAYYLFFSGSIGGVLARGFLRNRPVYPLLLTGTLTLLIATLNPFVAVGFFLANIVAADIYGRYRNTLGEIAAVAAGNAVFTLLLVGYWLMVAPQGVWKALLFYPLSLVVETFLLFGLEKLLDLLPHMYSDGKLEKLANLSNPLIEEMMLRAPGTYHHSVMVSLLAEALARKIGADALLTRVGAMFHDIGKLVNPQYFIENVNGENPHKNLKPEVSASIIKSHVEEGIALARKYNLPEEVVKFIPEHQGTKLIKYFYYKALEENPSVEEEKFRYRGPIPHSKETALVMIADTVEAMVRAIKHPTEQRIKETVKKALDTLQKEGQLEAAGFSPGELEQIEKHLVELLLSYYHERIKYPEKPRRGQRV